ncbi:MAG: DUF4185 domain-containing protein [Ardenticatenaceae bacterium]|nr:DUF4185 domain-containing protein [Ardenticatenaceae bacterium]
MREEVKQLALTTKGFLSEAEGLRLYELAAESSRRAPCLEIGSYCGRSTLFLAEGCRMGGSHPLFAIDHHQGSEEQQAGQAYFDPDLFDAREGVVNTLGSFMSTLRRAGLTEWVIPIVTESRRASRYWPETELSLVFLDGGHSEEDAFQDFRGWSRRVLPGGYLCIHDVFDDPAEGGQAPYHVREYARSTGEWEDAGQVETLAILRRRPEEPALEAEPAMPASPETTAPVRAACFLGGLRQARTDSWAIIGQDGGQSIDLGDRILFVFSDTLFAALPNLYHNESLTAPYPVPAGRQGIFLANSAGLSRGDDLRQALGEIRYYTDEEGFPREIIEPTGPEREQEVRFWPEHGISLDGKVYLYYLGVQTVDRSSIWGFHTLGAGLAVLDPESGACERIRRENDWCLWRAEVDDFHFGVQVLRDDEDVYVFASVRKGLLPSALLARVKADQIADPAAYEYLYTPQPEWGPDLEGALSLGESGSEYSVSYNPYLGRYLMIYVEGYGKTLMMRTADRLFGPYSQPQQIGHLPHDRSSELLYLGFEHPTYRKNDGETVYITYCQPRFTANSLIAVRFG